MSKARGHYLGFVDADDFIAADLYEKLYREAVTADCDVVISNFESEQDGHLVATNYPFPTDTYFEKDFILQKVIPYLIEKEDLNTACSKIYKTELIKEKEIVFPPGVALGEDGLFNIRFFSVANSMKYVDYTGYYYREVAGSATRNLAKTDYFRRALEVYQTDLPEITSIYHDSRHFQQWKDIKLIRAVMAYTYLYFLPTSGMSFLKRYKYIKNMIGNRFVQEAVPFFSRQYQHELGRYEKFILAFIKRRFVLGLYFATAYSRYRNK